MLLSLHGLTQSGHILVVFFETAGKTVVSVAVADKIEIVGLRRMHGRFERRSAGIRYGPRRQSGMSVGVVLGLKSHVGMMQRAGVTSVEQFRIDHAGIGLQRDVFPKRL